MERYGKEGMEIGKLVRVVKAAKNPSLLMALHCSLKLIFPLFHLFPLFVLQSMMDHVVRFAPYICALFFSCLDVSCGL